VVKQGSEKERRISAGETPSDIVPSEQTGLVLTGLVPSLKTVHFQAVTGKILKIREKTGEFLTKSQKNPVF
jgi:hypothetical protein